MKKFTKLLILLMLIATVFTVFTVVALAEEETPAPAKEAPYEFKYYSYDNQEVGYRGYEANHKDETSTGQGYFGVDESIYGNGTLNKFIKIYSEPKAGTAYPSYHTDLGYNSNSNYPVSKYPYVSIDFDIMKMNQDYNNLSLVSYMYYKVGTKDIYPAVYLSEFKSKLSSDVYDWSHVTIIYEYWSDKEGHYIASYVYVDGEYVTSNNKNKTLKEHDGYDITNYFHGEFRFNAETTDDASGNKATAIDNTRITYFSSEYSIKEVLGFHYNEAYEKPFGRTVAKIGDVQYDSLDKAIATAGEGDVIKLTESPKKAPMINKNVVIDAGEFAFEFTSTEGYDATVENGVYTIKKSSNTVTVKWDTPCNTDCDCYSQVGGHIMTSETVGVLGELPVYDKALPEFKTENGLERLFIGWSYENDGTADELKEITEADIANGTVTLYPVYKITQYSYEIISAAGTSTYLLENDFALLSKKITSGCTIKLHTDVSLTASLTLHANLTFDLNGHDLYSYYAVIQKYSATKDESGNYVKGDLIEANSALGASHYVFYMTNSTHYTFNLKSSVPGSNIFSGKLTYDEWICDGESVKYENVKIASYAGLVSLYPSRSTYNINGEGITFHTGTLFYGEHGSNNATTEININGGTYVIHGQPGEGALALRRGGTHTFSNATFILDNATLVKTARDNTHYVFNNCDIYDGAFYLTGANNSLTLNNCRLDGAISSGTACPVYLGDDTMLSEQFKTTYAKLSLDEKLRIESKTTNKTFTYSTISPSMVDGKFTVTVNAASKSADMVNEVFNLDKDYNNVTWYDLNGEVLANTVALKNGTAKAPAVELPTDGFRAVTNPIWLDSEGNASNLAVGDAGEYSFTASLPGEADRNYTEYMTVAMFNLTYFAHFGYNLYAPVVDGVTYTSIGGKTSYSTVMIDGLPYYVVNVGYPDSTNALEDETKDIVYKIDGKEYKATFKLNALLYANIIIADEMSSDIEKEAVGCLVRYIEESYKLVAGENGLDDATAAKFASFYENYVPADYVTEYPEAKTVDEVAIGGLIESISFTVRGARVALVVTLTDYAVENNYTVYLSGLSFGLMYTPESGANAGKVWYSNNTPLTTHLMRDTYWISVYEADGKTVVKRDINGDGNLVEATTKYNLATYIVATDNDLAKSLYALGKAVIEVKESLSK